MTGIRLFAVLRSMATGIRTIFNVIFSVSILLAVLAIVQRQEPLFDIQMNPSNKVLTIDNDGFPPIGVKMYVVRFDLTFYVDERGHLQTPDEITGFSTAGFISKNKTVWPLFIWRRLSPKSQLQVDLKDDKLLSFVDNKAVPKSVYCVIVDARSILSNQHGIKTVLTLDTKFAASPVGPQSEGAAEGGDYAAAHKLWDLEDRVKQGCLRVYENYSISVG